MDVCERVCVFIISPYAMQCRFFVMIWAVSLDAVCVYMCTGHV